MKLNAEVVVPLVAALLALPGYYWTFLRERVEKVRLEEISHSRSKTRNQRDAARKWTVTIGVLLAFQICFAVVVVLGGVDALLSIGQSAKIDVMRVAALAGCVLAIGGLAVLGHECRQIYNTWQKRNKALEESKRL